MRREQYKRIMDNGCIFYAPLTNDSLDVVGGKVSIREAALYGADGAFFNATQKYLAYELTEEEFKSVKTIYLEFKRTTDKYETMTLHCLGGLTGNVYGDSSSNQDGVNRSYRNIWHNFDCLTGKFSKNDKSDWKSDYDDASNTIVTKDSFHKAVTCTYSNSQHIWLDGTQDLLRTDRDTFYDYDFTQHHHTGLYFFVGGRTLRKTENKEFEGYIRNVMMFNKEFSNAELAAMTAL